MVREEFATGLCIEPSRCRAAGGFSCQIQRYCVDDGISNQELPFDLNLAGIRSPVLLDCAPGPPSFASMNMTPAFSSAS
jgi:hypothetical protein